MDERISGEDCDRHRTGAAEPHSVGAPPAERVRGPSGTALTTGPLDRRLALRALALALRPGFEATAAADTLAALAADNRTALLRAIARVGGGLGERSGPISDRAAAALRVALARLDGADIADFLVHLQDQVLDAFASTYGARADSAHDGHRPADPVRPWST